MNEFTGNMNLHVYLSQIIPSELFVVSFLVLPPNFTKNKCVPILGGCSSIINENRSVHVECRKITRLNPRRLMPNSPQLCFYMCINLHVVFLCNLLFILLGGVTRR
jgi:hypothetical protein